MPYLIFSLLLSPDVMKVTLCGLLVKTVGETLLSTIKKHILVNQSFIYNILYVLFFTFKKNWQTQRISPEVILLTADKTYYRHMKNSLYSQASA